MRKIIIASVLLATVSLGGCANLKNAWEVISSAAVTPQQIIIAGNSFDALEATATQYLLYCKSAGASVQACALGNRVPVVKAVRAGRAARNALEPYVVSGTVGPVKLFNTLIGAINTLQKSSMPVGAK